MSDSHLPQTAPVSVVIPCYRNSATVDRALASVAKQTVWPREVIVVDDGSEDDTPAALQTLAARHPAGWVRVLLLDRNVGAASARNAGWALASQSYVAFLDADDAWHPEKIAIQHAHMSANPELALCGHAHVLMTTSGLPGGALRNGLALAVDKWPLLRSNPFVTPSVMLRRDLGFRFEDGQRYMEDHLLWMRIVCAGLRADRLPQELAAVYKPSFGAAGLSSRLWLMQRGDLDNYRRLRREGHLRAWQFVMLSVYSWLKFGRRLVIKGWRDLTAPRR